MLKALKVVHLNEVSESILIRAGRVKARHHVSLADALIAAFALGHKAVLVHKDPEYEALKDLSQEILPCKKRR